MPSSLERVLSRALACSASPPVSVCSTITCSNPQSFSRQCGITQTSRGCPWDPQSNKGYGLSSCVPLVNRTGGAGILTGLAIGYAPGRGLTLDIDLPWEDEPSPGNLRLSAGRISTCLFVTYADILTSVSSTVPRDTTSTYYGTLLYRLPPTKSREKTRSFGNKLSSVCFRRRIARPVSCYALFKGWLLLSQPPGCLSNPTSFPT